jgi:hypothetical protein
MAITGLDTYIADTQFRSRNPLFKTSETYHTEQEKRRLKRSKGKRDSLVKTTFILTQQTIPAFVPRKKSCGYKIKEDSHSK